jgi:hypothetical protein
LRNDCAVTATALEKASAERPAQMDEVLMLQRKLIDSSEFKKIAWCAAGSEGDASPAQGR